MVMHNSVEVQWVLSGTYLGIMGKMKKNQNACQSRHFALCNNLRRGPSFENTLVPPFFLLCHIDQCQVAVGHYTLELGLRSLVCKVLCSALLPEP
jgi:hypothetical protein